MTPKKYLMLGGGALIAIGLNAYFFLGTLVQQTLGTGVIAKGEECKDEPSTAVSSTKENTNKRLFVSCSGFLE